MIASHHHCIQNTAKTSFWEYLRDLSICAYFQCCTQHADILVVFLFEEWLAWEVKKINMLVKLPLYLFWWIELLLIFSTFVTFLLFFLSLINILDSLISNSFKLITIYRTRQMSQAIPKPYNIISKLHISGKITNNFETQIINLPIACPHALNIKRINKPIRNNPLLKFFLFSTFLLQF